MGNLIREMETMKKTTKFKTETIHIRNEKFRRQVLSRLKTMEEEIIEFEDRTTKTSQNEAQRIKG